MIEIRLCQYFPYACHVTSPFYFLVIYGHIWLYVFECMIFFQENTIISNKAFNTFVFKSIIRFKCLSSHKIVLHIRSSIYGIFERPYMSHHLSNLFVVSFDDVIIINYKSNILWKNCIDVTFHVVFVTFCHDINGC